MGTHPWIALQEQYEKGAPVRAVDPADIKHFWVAQRAMEAEFSPRPDHATGRGTVGFNVSSRGPEFETELFFISIRIGLLASLVDRGVLRDYQNGDELDERVFRAAATVPFNYEEWCESRMALKIPEYPADLVAKVKQDFRDHRYDLDHPRIDAKFLAYLRDSC